MTKHHSQRLFFALWPDADTRLGLHRVSNALSGHCGRVHQPDDLHITLAFLGRVSPDQYTCLMEAADEVIITPFELTIDKIELWRRPGILWCGPSHIPDQLQKLVADLKRRLYDCGFEPEKRVYTPHVTLARKSRLLPDYQIHQPLRWQVRGFVLASSDDAGSPPRYKVIKKWFADS
ncbi:MAG: RNA 2',3'-cyclic phosphodiesterase [Candidatus Sedimenticola sp. (ex Thyasira tokunagai)]